MSETPEAGTPASGYVSIPSWLFYCYLAAVAFAAVVIVVGAVRVTRLRDTQQHTYTFTVTICEQLPVFSTDAVGYLTTHGFVIVPRLITNGITLTEGMRLTITYSDGKGLYSGYEVVSNIAPAGYAPSCEIPPRPLV